MDQQKAAGQKQWYDGIRFRRPTDKQKAIRNVQLSVQGIVEQVSKSSYEKIQAQADEIKALRKVVVALYEDKINYVLDQAKGKPLTSAEVEEVL